MYDIYWRFYVFEYQNWWRQPALGTTELPTKAPSQPPKQPTRGSDSSDKMWTLSTLTFRYLFAQVETKWYLFAKLGTKRYLFAQVGTKRYLFAQVGTKRYLFAQVGTKRYLFAQVGTKRYLFAQVGTKDRTVYPPSQTLLVHRPRAPSVTSCNNHSSQTIENYKKTDCTNW